jgi:protein involved in ribonucleotide reduction
MGRIADDVEKYNKAALDVLRSYPEITFNDLYAYTKPNHARWCRTPLNVHYNNKGMNAQGDEVARIILESLSKKNRPNRLPLN